jgi:phenylacetate-coenzyme A ligase PaaK-like adenylate-forming protein
MGRTISIVWQALRLIARGRYPRERLEAMQQARLRRLLNYAARHSPFYRQRFAGIDLDHCRLADLPPLSKVEMMDQFDTLVTDRRLNRAGVQQFIENPGNQGKLVLDRYAVCHTSGSQGQPALVVQELDHMLLSFVVQLARGQVLRRHPLALLFQRLRQPARLAVVTQRPGFYPSSVAFSHLGNAQLPFLRLLRLSVFDSAPELVMRLNDFRPHYLIGYTSSLELLAREEQAGRLRLRASGCLEQVSNMSEPLPPSSREAIEKAFGVHISDHYDMAECLALSSGCPLHAGSHVNIDLACLEVVDDAGRPVPDGTQGSKVLITNLYNYVQPLIRYELGDVLTMSPTPCPCGSPLPLIQAIIGRTKERLWVEANGQYHELAYYLFLHALNYCVDVAEHQIVQTRHNHFLVRVAPQPGKSIAPERVKQRVDHLLAMEGLARDVVVEVEIVDEIGPDPRTGKRKRVQSLVEQPPALVGEHAG